MSVTPRPDVLADLLALPVEEAIAQATQRYSNHGRWGGDDVLGTLNFLTPQCRAAAAALVRTGLAFSRAQAFDGAGPQTGWRGRINPLHTMMDTGTEAAAGRQGFPHGFGGADDMIVMPLQASTQWDGLGHIFDHGVAWNGRSAGDVVTTSGDQVTGIETAAGLMAGRGVLLDVGRAVGESGELPDGYAIRADDIAATIEQQGPTAEIRSGDFALIRTGQLTRVRRAKVWGSYAGGASPGLSFASVGWLHDSEVTGVATDTWGFEVRPNEFEGVFQPLHQVVIPWLGLYLGEMWDLDALTAHCAGTGVYEFFLTAAPIPFTGAVGSPVNPLAVL